MILALNAVALILTRVPLIQHLYYHYPNFSHFGIGGIALQRSSELALYGRFATFIDGKTCKLYNSVVER